MRNIVDTIDEAYSAQGNELQLHDFIEFETAGITVLGIIVDIDGDETYTIKPFGVRGKDNEGKVKKQYKIKAKSAKRMWNLAMPDEIKDKLLKTL